METKIFAPLGMSDTGFWVPAHKRDRLATYYRGGGEAGSLVPVGNNDTRYATPPVLPSGAGGLVSTVDDYLTFARMLLQEGEVDGVRLLSRKSVELMTTDQLTEDPDKRFFVSPGFWRGAGFEPRAPESRARDSIWVHQSDRSGGMGPPASAGPSIRTKT